MSKSLIAVRGDGSVDFDGARVVRGVLLGVGAVSASAVLVLAALLALGVGDDPLIIAELLWKVLAGTAGLGGVYAAMLRIDLQQSQLETSRQQFASTMAVQQSQLDEGRSRFHEEQTGAIRKEAATAFARALEQLGSDSRIVRIGAISTLEAVAREWPEHRWTMVKVLSAFLCCEPLRTDESLSRIKMAEETGKVPIPFEDIDAAVDALRRRQVSPGEDSVNLDRAWLVASDFTEARLSGASFWKTRLRLSSFRGAKLSGARFPGADLTLANFDGADLSDVSFVGAELAGATFVGANLDGADFARATGVSEDHLSKARSRRRLRL